MVTPLTIFPSHSHSKADCPEPRKMGGACFNCGEEGWVYKYALWFLGFGRANRDPVTPRLIAPSLVRWELASTVARKGECG